MYDPIPWYINCADAQLRSFDKSGWCVMRYDGAPVVGPYDTPEECVIALGDLTKRGSQQLLANGKMISTLRKTYGESFAPGIAGRCSQSDALHQLDEPSLSKLVRDLRKK